MCRITGYSFTMPLAPSTSRARRAISSAWPTLLRFASDTCSGRTWPASFSWPSRHARSWALVISFTMWTSFACTSWKLAERLVELRSRLRVVERRQVAGARRADGAPHDAVARLVQARERTRQPLRAGKLARRRHTHVLEHQLRRDGRAQRELPLDVVAREARRAALHQEAADHALVVLRPHDGDVGDGAVRDPALRAAQDPVRRRRAGHASPCRPGPIRGPAR